MPDQEVLINDSNLNAIANAIRRKNGLVRTYKPREMAPAIRAINSDAPDSREYTVTVIQTPHQTIKVRQVLGGEKQYDQSFTVSEPYWKIQATIEPEAGYTAGALNYPNEVTVDRDITIKATPATIETFDDPIDINIYVKGMQSVGSYDFYGIPDIRGYGVPKCWANEDCTSKYLVNYPEQRPFMRLHYIDKNDIEQLYMDWLFGSAKEDYKQSINRNTVVTEITQNINFSGVKYARYVIGRAEYLEYIDLSNWDVSSCENMDNFINNCPRLKSIGDISYWNTQNLRTCNNFLGNLGLSSNYDTLESLDVSHWNTPELRTASNFVSGKIRTLDISNWDTSKITSFSVGNTMKYIIMDKDEIKFNGSYIMPNPNVNCKYLVPEDWVDDYKQHPNWVSRASQIDSVTNYTINRGDGQIEVVPNW